MDDYTDNSYREQYNKWREVQNSHNYIMSYSEWLDVFIYKLTK